MTTETFRILTFCFSVQIVYSVPANHFLYEDIDKNFSHVNSFSRDSYGF